jgi:hypothetical protein
MAYALPTESIKKGCFVNLFPLTKKSFATMKVFSESIKNFWEGFISFYTSIYKEIKGW